MFGLLVVGFQGSLGTLRALEHATHLYKLILKLIPLSPPYYSTEAGVLEKLSLAGLAKLSRLR
jgi:hypothetical protein